MTPADIRDLIRLCEQAIGRSFRPESDRLVELRDKLKAVLKDAKRGKQRELELI